MSEHHVCPNCVPITAYDKLYVEHAQLQRDQAERYEEVAYTDEHNASCLVAVDAATVRRLATALTATRKLSRKLERDLFEARLALSDVMATRLGLTQDGLRRAINALGEL